MRRVSFCYTPLLMSRCALKVELGEHQHSGLGPRGQQRMKIHQKAPHGETLYVDIRGLGQELFEEGALLKEGPAALLGCWEGTGAATEWRAGVREYDETIMRIVEEESRKLWYGLRIGTIFSRTVGSANSSLTAWRKK